MLVAALLAAHAAAKTCAAVSGNHGVTNKNDVGRAPVTTVTACAAACQSSPKCCIAEFDAKAVRCYLKYAGNLTAAPTGITSITCTPPCSAPPTPPLGRGHAVQALGAGAGGELRALLLHS